MAQRRLMIELPGSADALQNVLKILLQHGLVSKKKVNAIQQAQPTEEEHKAKSRWTKAAERLRSENCLKGRSGEVKNLFREFREDFEM